MQCKMRFSFCSHPVDNKRTIKMGCLPLPLPLLETCVIFFTYLQDLLGNPTLVTLQTCLRYPVCCGDNKGVILSRLQPGAVGVANLVRNV